MNKKLIKLIASISAAAILPVIPATAAEDGIIPSAQTVTLNPSECMPFNNGEFEGWGTSLCWWANRVGYSEALTKQAAELFYSDKGLSLDIARYNLGGGDAPTHNHITRSDSKIPCYATGIDEQGNISYDWSADQNQRNVALAAKAANPDIYFEGFSNSPPYFMTISGCSSGAEDAANDNLAPEQYDNFAKFIAETTAHFKNDFGIEFKSYSPMNEPDTTYWGKYSYKQEGCHYSPGATQSGVIAATRKALDNAGLNEVLVASMDETSIDKSVANLDLLTDEAKTALGRIDTHTYGGSKRAELKAKAQEMGKDLWMSEVDGGWDGFGLAERIILDMNELMPTAWVMWDIVDRHKDSKFQTPNGDFSEANAAFTEKDKLWGVGMADHDAQELLVGNKYYAFGQFTRYIEPGDTIIASSDNTLAAYNKESGDVKVVVSNATQSAQKYVFDLSAFTQTGTQVEQIRTSDDGEKWAQITDGASLEGKRLKTTVKPRSVNTYIVKGTGHTDYAYIEGADEKLGVGDTVNLSVKSNLESTDAIKWNVTDGANAQITADGVLTVTGSGSFTVYAENDKFKTERTFNVPRYKMSGTQSWTDGKSNPKSSEEFKMAADGDLSSYFNGKVGGYVMYDYGAPYKAEKVVLAPAAKSGMAMRTAGGTVQGSNDGISWTTLYTIQKPLETGKYTEIGAEKLNSDKAYRYYRCTNGKNAATIAEFRIMGAAAEASAGEPTVMDIAELTDDFESETNMFNAPKNGFEEQGNTVYTSNLSKYKNVFAPVRDTAKAALTEPISLNGKDVFRLKYDMFAGWERDGKENSLTLTDANGNELLRIVITSGGYCLNQLWIGGVDVLAGVERKPAVQCMAAWNRGANRWGHSSQFYTNTVGFNKECEIRIGADGAVNVALLGGAGDLRYSGKVAAPVSIGALSVTGDYVATADNTVSYDNFDADLIQY